MKKTKDLLLGFSLIIGICAAIFALAYFLKLYWNNIFPFKLTIWTWLLTDLVLGVSLYLIYKLFSCIFKKDKTTNNHDRSHRNPQQACCRY